MLCAAIEEAGLDFEHAKAAMLLAHVVDLQLWIRDQCKPRGEQVSGPASGRYR